MRSYSLDAHDQLLSVTGDWDAFALRNRGEGAVAARVTGRYLWDFVTGAETRAYLSRLFHDCRMAGAVLKTTYRCDSPAEERLCRMEILPGPAGRIEVRHQLVRQRVLPVIPLQDLAGLGRFWRCSQCKGANPGGHWLDHRHFAPPPGARQIDVVCPTCEAAAMVPVAAGSGDEGPMVV